MGEVWLDCLVTAIERETDDPIVSDVLRTTETMDATKADAKSSDRAMGLFYENANEVLNILEFKARKKYYECLEKESQIRQEQLQKQNDVLHDYVWELEREFTKVMEEIHKQSQKGFDAHKACGPPRQARVQDPCPGGCCKG